MTALQVITLRGPQFVADPRLSILITYATAGLDAVVFGDRHGEAVGLKVLHILTLEQLAGGSVVGAGTSSGVVVGGVASKSEGDLSINFRDGGANAVAVLVARNPDLSSTQFGLELLALIRATIFCPLNRMM